MAELFVPLAGIIMIISLVAMKNKHKLEEMKILRGHSAGNDVTAEIRQLQQQINELRDTTTRYDMSFDAALQRLESRVGHIETQQRETQSNIAQH